MSKRIGGKVILKDVDLKLASGHVLNVVGRSGAGKSMLLKCINRLVEPTSGDVLVDRRSILRMDPVKLRRRVGMVFQEPVMFDGAVWENLLYGLDVETALDLPVFKEKRKNELFGRYEDEMLKLLSRVGLRPSFLARTASSLSGGEKQRVAIARALGARPEVLLMDEPTSALDERSKTKIERLALKLNKDLGLTIILVTHDPAQASRLGDITLRMHKGRVKWFGNTCDLGGDVCG